MNKIFLVGYMGCGKSTIGRLLAKRLQWSFVDMDAYIENRHHKTINELFAERGEEVFRRLERSALEEISCFDLAVISTGGGAPCFFDNIDLMNQSGICIYIAMTPEALSRRLAANTQNRPLLRNKKEDELQLFIRTQLAQRQPFYDKAIYKVNNDEKKPQDTAEEIFNLLNSA